MGLTIPQIKEILVNQVKLINNGEKPYVYKIVLQCNGSLTSLVNYWNNNNDTDTITAGALCSFSLFDIYSENYFRGIFSSYGIPEIYEFHRTGGTWSKMRQIFTSAGGNLKGTLNFDMTGNIISTYDSNYMRIVCGDDIADSPFIFFNGNDSTGTNEKGIIDLYSQNTTSTTPTILHLDTHNGLLYRKWSGRFADLGSASIIEKSIVQNGYIKYTCGLILQWGSVNVSNRTDISITYPITFNQLYSFVSTYGSEDNSPCYFSANGSTSTNYIAFNVTASSNAWLSWFAIGY